LDSIEFTAYHESSQVVITVFSYRIRFKKPCLVTPTSHKEEAKLGGFTAGDLLEVFLTWVRKHRSPSTATTRRIYCERFDASARRFQFLSEVFRRKQFDLPLDR
jgi:hypothetical protein